MSKPPRGIRNNNPGNIDYMGTDWQGLSKPESDGRFCRFETPEWGIRALAKTLLTYQTKRKAADGSKIDTVAEFIHRWAPPVENDTGAYVAQVAGKMGVGPHDEIDVRQYRFMEPLVESIIRHENGIQPYTQAQIDEGLRRAGVVAGRAS